MIERTFRLTTKALLNVEEKLQFVVVYGFRLPFAYIQYGTIKKYNDCTKLLTYFASSNQLSLDYIKVPL